MIKKRIKNFVLVIFLFVFMLSTLSVSVHAELYKGRFSTAELDSLSHEFNPSTGELTIGGIGKLSASSVPWDLFSKEIKSVKIGVGVKSIEKYAFSRCPNLELVIFEGNLESVASCVFWKNMKLESVIFKGNVGIFGEGAFSGCGRLTHFEYLGIDPIGFYGRIFDFCDSLREVYVGAKYEGSEFGGLPVKRLSSKFAVQNMTIHSAINQSIRELTVSGKGCIPNCAPFVGIITPWREYDDEVNFIVIKDGISGVGGYSFFNFENLESVSLPQGLLCIGVGAFYNCSNLKRINLPNTIESIGASAFENCVSLTTIDIPGGAWIGKRAFAGCYNLSTVKYHGTTQPFFCSKKVFKRCPNLKSVQVPVNYKGHHFCGIKVEKVLKG